MKYLLAFLLAGTVAVANATEFRVTDGKVEFASTTVNGETAWTTQEHDALVARFSAMGGTTTLSVTQIVPTADEINLSTTVGSPLGGVTLRWNSAEEFLACQTKAGLRMKYRSLKPIIDALIDLVFTGDDRAMRRAWLVAFYQRAP